MIEEISVANTETWSDNMTISLNLLLNSKILVSDWNISSTGNDNTTFLDKHIVRVYIKEFIVNITKTTL